MANKTKKNVTADALRKEAAGAIDVIRSLISNLTTVNEKAVKAQADNSEQIASLERENADLAVLCENNEKIVHNFENLLSM